MGPSSAVDRAYVSKARDHGFDTHAGHILSFLQSAESRRAVVSYWQKCAHEGLVNCFGSLSMPIKSMVELTDQLDMSTVVYPRHKTIRQQTHYAEVVQLHGPNPFCGNFFYMRFYGPSWIFHLYVVLIF